MKTNPSKADVLKFSIIILGIVSIMLFSCSKGNEIPQEKFELSGEQMYREIILLDGENIESKIPEYSEALEVFNSLSEEEKQERAVFCDEVIAGINKIDPNYFNHFKSVIESKDNYLIETELVEGSKIMTKALLKSEKYSSEVSLAIQVAEKESKNYDLTKEEEVNLFINQVKQLSCEHQIKEKSTEGSYRAQGVGTNSGKCVAAVGVLYVAAAAAESLVAANMIAVASVFVYLKGKFWSGPLIVSPTSSGLTNSKITVSVTKSYF